MIKLEKDTSKESQRVDQISMKRTRPRMTLSGPLGETEQEGKQILFAFVSERKRKTSTALEVMFGQQSERHDLYQKKKQVF